MRLEFRLKKKGKSSWPLKGFIGLLIFMGFLGIYLSPVGRTGVKLTKDTWDMLKERSHWQLDQVVVEGHKRTDKKVILDALKISKDQDMSTISLYQMRQNLLNLPWVKDALIERHLPDTLIIHIIEKTPVALWQNNQTYHPLDEAGKPIEDDKLLPADLILVVGPDAPENTLALLAALEQVPSINALVRSAVRIEKRRWDLRLMDPEKGLKIMLPETGFDKALKRLEHQNAKENLFKKNIDAINIMLEDRTIVKKEVNLQKKAKKK